MRHSDNLISVNARDEAAVNLRHAEVVIDDHHRNHARALSGLAVSVAAAGVTVIRATNSAPSGVFLGDDLAAAPFADQQRQGQADAAFAALGRLRGVAVFEDLSRELGVDTGARVGDDQLDRGIGLTNLNSHPGVLFALGDDRVDSVVDQVAEHGGHIERGFAFQRRQARPVADPQSHLLLRGERGLGQQQRGHRTILDPAGNGQVQRRSLLDQGVDEAHHFVIVTDLDQPGDGVQLVAELVSLRAEQVRRAAEGAQLAFDLGQLRAVPQGGHRPDRAAVVHDRHPVQDEHPTGADDDLVGVVLPGVGQDIAEPPSDAEIIEALADRVGGQREQGGRQGVDEGDLIPRCPEPERPQRYRRRWLPAARPAPPCRRAPCPASAA